MLLHIVARGKIGRGPEAELVERYLKRVSWPVKVTELPESGGPLPPPARHAVPHPPHAGTAVPTLRDEKGEPTPSVDFARRLERWRDEGKREARFLIGG